MNTTTLPKTFLYWCKEYVNSIEQIKKIVEEIKATTINVSEYAKYDLLIKSNTVIKQTAENKLMEFMDNFECVTKEEKIAGLLIIAPYMR